MAVDWRLQGSQAKHLFQVASRMIGHPPHSEKFTLCTRTLTIQCPSEEARQELEKEVRAKLSQTKPVRPKRKERQPRL
jgi:hypothetical protein